MEINEQVVQKLLGVVDAGLCRGAGKPNPGEMCVEAAVCYALGEPHGDQPTCVHPAVINFKICLNDANWSSNEARAIGLREIAVAQLGSKDIDAKQFAKYVTEQVIRRILPIALRAIGLEVEAVRCEQEGSRDAAIAARDAARVKRDAAAHAAHAAAHAADAAYAVAADAAAHAAHAAHAAYAAAADAAHARGKRRDVVLSLTAQIGVEALRLCGAAGVAYLHLCQK